jgi:hypothetical protein
MWQRSSERSKRASAAREHVGVSTRASSSMRRITR